jgi:hypothetical protein
MTQLRPERESTRCLEALRHRGAPDDLRPSPQGRSHAHVAAALDGRLLQSMCEPRRLR